MSGKAILILAVSFSTIFLVTGKSFFDISNKSTNEMTDEINDKRATEIARSATDVVLSYFWQQPDSIKLIDADGKTFYDSVQFNGGRVTSKLKPDPVEPDLFRITTKAYYGEPGNQKKKTIVVLYGPQKLTEMASYSESSGNIWWTGADTVKGKVYCRSSIKVYDHPTFLNDVYSRSSGFSYFRSGGNWTARKLANEPNVDPNNLHFNTELKRPSGVMAGLRDKARASGWYVNGTRARWNQPSKDTMFIDINGSSMDVKFTKDDPPATYNIGTKVPNGIIYANNYVVRLKGQLDGQLLITCNGSRSKGKGKILLDDDITYAADPRDGPSDDLLGIVAQNYVVVADTPPNQADIDIHAAVYVQSKGLTAENAITKADAGTINFYGSLIEGRRMEVGSFTAGGALTGYGRKYEYDERLKNISPPGFPKLAGFNVLAWYEGDSAKN
ncbi:MAG: hypothetical protein V3V16_13080 [Melioribacteraceae bacterium]